MNKIIMDGQEFDVVIERKNIKNIYLRIIDKTTLRITCHYSIPMNVIHKFILSKQSWIQNTIIRKEDDKRRNKVGINGPNLFLFGEPYYLNVILTTYTKVLVHDNIIDVYVTSNNEEEVLKVFYSNARKILGKKVLDLRKHWELELLDYGNFEPTITFRLMKRKWGVCVPSKNKITLNVLLIHYPVNCLDYVLWHEYCHLVVPNHSKRFYELVQSKMPNYKELKELLK